MRRLPADGEDILAIPGTLTIPGNPYSGKHDEAREEDQAGHEGRGI